MYVPHERRALILRLLEQRGYLRSAELARELGVTEETIRTDIIALHKRRLLTRVHGGAKYTLPTGGEEDAARLDCQLAERVLRHVRPGMCLYLEGGSPALSLLGLLGELPCRIITPSPRVLMAISAKATPQQGVIAGGELDKECQLVSAEAAEEFLARQQPELALLCPPALPEPGRIAYHHATRAAWAAAAAASAGRTLLAAPAHAIGAAAAHSLPCRPHLLITEDHLPEAFFTMPVELLPYISVEDLRQDDDSLSLR